MTDLQSVRLDGGVDGGVLELGDSARFACDERASVPRGEGVEQLPSIDRFGRTVSAGRLITWGRVDGELFKKGEPPGSWIEGTFQLDP